MSLIRLTKIAIPGSNPPANSKEIVMDTADDVIKSLDSSGTLVSLEAGAGGGETNTASNVNVGGVGVFKQKTALNLEFRGIIADSSKITVVLDGANNEIGLDVVEANILGSNINNDSNWNNYVHPNHSGDVVSVADGAQTIQAGVVTDPMHAASAAWTLKMNATAGAAAEADVKISALVDGVTVDSGTFFVNELSTGELRQNLVSDIDHDQLVNFVADEHILHSGVELTVEGTANEIDSSAGAQTIAASRTWTLGLPTTLIVPGSLELPNAAGGGTIDVAGKVGVDTTPGTLNFHDDTAERVLSPLH